MSRDDDNGMRPAYKKMRSCTLSEVSVCKKGYGQVPVMRRIFIDAQAVAEQLSL